MTRRRRAPTSTRLLAPALLLSVVAATGCGSQLIDGHLAHTSVATYDIAAPVREIVVMNGRGDIDLVPGAKRVAVRETRHYAEREPRLERRVHDGVLTLTGDCNECAFDLRVSVPARTEVRAEVGSGNIEARGVDVSDAHLQSHSGDVTVRLKGRQRLVSAHTDSGNVDASAADAHEIDAGSHSGDVTVDGGRSPFSVMAQTESGDVAVSVPAGDYALDAVTTVGDVTVDGITRNDRASRSIQASTRVGDVHVRAR